MKKSLVVFVILFFLFLGGNFLFSFPLITSENSGYKLIEDIPENIKNSIIRIEDRRFFYHPGIDPIAIGRSILHNIPLLWNSQPVHLQGASTIDQQLIKLTQQAFTRTWSQKLKEQFLALNLQFHYSKEEIFVAYVNNIPFSHGIKGWKEACDIYFKKSCHLLNNAELSYLLAVAQLGINPYNESNQKRIFQRAKILCSGDSCPLLSLPYYIELYSKNQILDPRVSLFLGQEPSEVFRLRLYQEIHSILSTTKALRQQYNANDCCVVVVDKNGKLLSMNLCSNRNDAEAGKINLCLNRRQTGSAIKPFLYLYAMMTKGIQPDDTIIDEPVSFDIGDGAIYEPKNFDLKHHGPVTIAYALGNSLNIPAIKLTEIVGVTNFLGFLKEQLTIYASGFDNNNKNSENLGLSIGLGTYEISPYAFTKLRTLFLQDNQQSANQKSAIIEILSNPNNKVASFGQDSFLNTPGWAVKTGTSRKFIDGRVCGVNTKKELTMCIWIGNYNNESMKAASSEVASYIWYLITKILD